MIVCSRENKLCMVHRCENCPRTDNLLKYLQEQFNEMNGEYVTYNPWESTDRPTLTTHTVPVYEFIELLVSRIDALTLHSVPERKEN